MIHEFQQLRWVTTAKGEGCLWAMLDYGPEADTLFLVCLNNGELWWLPQSEIRAYPNQSLQRPNPTRLDK